MLDDNKKYLNKLGNALDVLKSYNEEDTNYSFKIEKTKRSKNTLILEKNKDEIYFHSKYNPIREAESVVNTFGEINNDSKILFIGTGLGYHIKLILEKYPNIKCYIYEPIPKLMNEFLKEFNLEEYRDNIKGFNIGDDFYGQTLYRFLDVYKDIKIIILPSHENHFEKETKEVTDEILEYLKYSKNSIYANLLFQENWIFNGMKNLKSVLGTPNILLDNRDRFIGKTAVLVAAGPSLDLEIENIKEIKENELAYIFSVGSAINTLIYYNIYPDFATSYDPKPTSHGVFRKLKERNIKEIPLIFGSSINYKTLIDYPGDMYHVMTSQDTTSEYYLKPLNNKENIILADASTVAVITLQILNYLGFSKIIFVGQNLAYVGNKNHSDAVHYSKKVTDDFIKNEAIQIDGVDGEKVYTNEGYLFMKEQIENYIESYPHIEFINTTKGGAKIEGTVFKELSDIIKDLSNEKKLKIKEVEKIYDRDYLKKQYKEMQRKYYEAKRINKNYKKTLKQIKYAIDKNKFDDIERLYIRLNDNLTKIEENDFYKTYILPIQRVEYKILADSIDVLNEIEDEQEKANSIYNKFMNFIKLSEKNIEKIDPYYDEVKLTIEKYLE